MPGLVKGPKLFRLLVEAVRDHNVLPLTGRCNLACLFCSHRYNPPGTRAYSFDPLSAETLLKLAVFLDPGKKIIIGESATRLREGEPLTHKSFLYLLEKLRSLFPATLIQVTTNGLLLDNQLVKKLAALQPLEIILSVNSISPEGRMKLMGDSNPAGIISLIEMLACYRIAFHGSIIALPHLVGFSDLRAALNHLEQAGARTIRLLLPGFTRLAEPALMPAAGEIENFYERVDSLQRLAGVPLLIEPPPIADLQALIAGVIKDSPAESAGLRTGDRILEIDGRKPFSRVEAFRMLTDRSDPGLTVRRQGGIFFTRLTKEASTSPGVAVAFDLDPEQADQVEAKIDPHGKNLMLVSAPAIDRWQVALRVRSIGNLELRVVQSAWFGGTINCAGLLTVGDYRVALAGVADLKSYRRILVPAISFDRGGYDLAGQHYFSLTAGGLAVKLV